MIAADHECVFTPAPDLVDVSVCVCGRRVFETVDAFLASLDEDDR